MSATGDSPRSEGQPPERLLSMFPAATREEWLRVAEAELDGAPTSRLTSATPEGIDLRAIYWPDDLPDHAADAAPGQPPFLRGTRASIPPDGAWLICQSIPDGPDANKRVHAALGRGATALELTPESPASLAEALAGVDLTAVALFVRSAPELALPLAEALETMCDMRRLRGALGGDPLGLDRLPDNTAPRYVAIAALTRWASERAPQMSSIQVDAGGAHEAGASAVEELAYALANAVEQTRALLRAGVSIAQIAPKVRMSFAVGTQIFMEIARVRAARLLWARAAIAFGASPDQARVSIHTRTGMRRMAQIDPHVNILRATVAAFAASAGGCDSMEVAPFDAAMRRPDRFSERVAINTQHLLREESHLGQVLDPGGGSWYIESLTDALARRAWALFQEIERQGGLEPALRAGALQAQIAAVAAQRARALATRREAMVGVTMYADAAERLGPEGDAAAGGGRDAAPFERLRRRAEQLGSPTAFLAAIGSRADYRARAEFCAGLLAIAGVRLIDQGDFATPDEAARAAAESGAPITVICAADARYPEVVAPLIAALRHRRPSAVVALAGMPADHADALRAAGVDQFLHLRADALATLGGILDQLSPAPTQQMSTP